MTRLVEVCLHCLAGATDALVHEHLLMQAQWCAPDVTVLTTTGEVQTWHEPIGFALMALRDPLMTSPN